VTIALVGQAGIAGTSAVSPAVISRTTAAGNGLILLGHLYDLNGGAFVAPTGITDTATNPANQWQVSGNAAQSVLITPSGSGAVPPTASLTDPSDGGTAHMADFVGWTLWPKDITSATLAFEGGLSTFRRLALTEWAGLGAFDNSWAGGSTSTATSVSAAVTVPGPGCLVIGAIDFGGGGTASLPAGWTQLTSGGGQLGFIINPPVGAYAPAFTTTVAASWAGAVAVFTPSGPGWAVPARPVRRPYGRARYRRGQWSQPAAVATTQQGVATLAASADLTTAPATLLAPAALAASIALAAAPASAQQPAAATLAAATSLAVPGQLQLAPATLSAVTSLAGSAGQLSAAQLSAIAAITTAAQQLAAATLTAATSLTAGALTGIVSGQVCGTSSSRVYSCIQATQAGDTLLAIANVNNNTCTVSALADSKGNVWTLDSSFATSGPTMYAFRCPGATGGSGGGPTAALATSDTFTLTTAAVSGQVSLAGITAGQVGALDSATAVAAHTGVSSQGVTSATPGQAGDTAVAAFVNSAPSGQPSVASPFSVVQAVHPGGSGAFQTFAIETNCPGTAQTATVSTPSSGNERDIMWLFAPLGTPPGVATLTAATSLAAPSAVQQAVATLAAAGSLTAPGEVQGATANMAALAAIAAPAVVQRAVVTLAALTSVVAPSALGAVASLAASWAVTNSAVEGAPATLIAAGSLGAPASRLLAPASLTAAWTLTGSTNPQGTSVLNAALALAAPGVQIAPATLTALAALSAPGTTASPATLTAATSLAATAIQRAAATLQAATALAGSGASVLPGAAAMSAATALLAAGVQGATALLSAQTAVAAPLSAQRAIATLTAQGQLSAPARVQAAAQLAALFGLAASGQSLLPVTRAFPLAAGAPHIRWSAGAPHARDAAASPNGHWAAGVPSARWAAQSPRVRWAAGVPREA